MLEMRGFPNHLQAVRCKGPLATEEADPNCVLFRFDLFLLFVVLFPFFSSPKQRAAGLEPSPLLKAIGFSLNMVMVDVLHCKDLGVSQDMLGNIFSEALDWVCAGTSRKKQGCGPLEANQAILQGVPAWCNAAGVDC